MSLNLVLLLVGVLGLGAAMWVQVRAFGDDPAIFARKRKRAGVGLVFLLLLLGIVQYIDAGTPGLQMFDAKEDGSWGAVAIDGRPVSSKDYMIRIEDRRVAAGRDGCNSWGFEDEPFNAAGERMIVSTLVGCPEDDPVRNAYWALATAPQIPLTLRLDGTMRLAAREHRAFFRRCEWVREPLPPETSGSGPEVCVIK